MSIPEKDLKILWGKAAGRCSMTECRKKLVVEASEKILSANVLVGQNCHIIAEKENGPRGRSILTLEERNRYPNLILLCANHHIEVDQDPGKWPVKKLHQIKADHEVWVETQLTDVTDDVATKIYSDLINSATEALLLSHWDWVSDHAVRLLLSEEFVHGSDFFSEKVHRAIWPRKIVVLEKAIQNVSDGVNFYVGHFMSNAKLRENSEKQGQVFYVEDKWWKAQWRDGYDDYVEKSNKWQNISTCLLFNVVFALNDTRRL
ncbi:hypothetical protein SAMN06295888_1521 [Desulfonatronum zhilinae]|nr:hypothetical protein SAMN06295888_1521 [Desulfonatronum zhilinae]